MMLSDVFEYHDFDFALSTFIDKFKISEHKDEMISAEPLNAPENSLNSCLMAATVHKLSNDYEVNVPPWVYKNRYISPRPVFAFDTENKEYQNYLIQITPIEFSSKNIFFGENVIDRV